MDPKEALRALHGVSICSLVLCGGDVQFSGGVYSFCSVVSLSYLEVVGLVLKLGMVKAVCIGQVMQQQGGCGVSVRVTPRFLSW